MTDIQLGILLGLLFAAIIIGVFELARWGRKRRVLQTHMLSGFRTTYTQAELQDAIRQHREDRPDQLLSGVIRAVEKK